MLQITLPQVQQWQLGRLSEWATNLETANQGYEYQLGRTVSHFQDLHGSWAGKAADAAYGRMDEENNQGRRLATETSELITAVRTGTDRITREREVLLGRVVDAETLPFSIDGKAITFSVGAQWRVLADYTAIRDLTEDIVRQIQAETDSRQGQINSAYFSFATAVEEFATAVTTNAGEIRSRGDILGNGLDVAGTEQTTGLTAEQGRLDGQTIADGKLSPEEIDRISKNLTAAGLTPTQLAALQRGEEVTVPASAMSYMTELYGSAGRDGLIGVSEQLRTDTTPGSQQLRSSLANGLLTVSNENVVGRDYRTGKDDRGGWNKLSPEVKEIVGTRPALGTDAPDSNTSRLPDDYRNNAWDSRNITGSYKEYQDDLGKFGDFLNSSGEGYQPGDRLGVELSRQAAHQAWLADSGEYRSVMNPNDVAMSDARADSTARDLLEVGTRNTDSNHALITGEGSPELFGSGEPGQTFNDGDKFKEVVAPMITRDWGDDGAAAAGMFSWINDDATSPNPEVATRAGESANVLANYVADNKSELLNLDGDRTESLGQRNPALLQGMAEGLSPYIPRLAGVPEGPPLLTSGFEWGTADPNFDRAKSVFTVMDSSKEAAEQFNVSALAAGGGLQSAWLSSALTDPHGGDNRLAAGYGTILGLVDGGLTAEAADRTRDEAAAAARNFADQGAGYDAAKGVLTGSIKYLPVVGPVASDIASNTLSPAIDVSNTYIKNAVLGVYLAPDPAQPNAPMAPGYQDPAATYLLTQSLQDLNGSVDHHPDFDKYFDANGSLRDYKQLSEEMNIPLPTIRNDLTKVLEEYNGRVLDPQLSDYTNEVANGRASVK
ncbi:TPR repeat region-containing protein [Nocardia sp. IBHARD005]|uniref:TPR repeat region-containing protein n=1 Tax=Nocardia sp. IBHARD005 TaxID=3457765 RepID=UPI0040583325